MGEIEEDFGTSPVCHEFSCGRMARGVGKLMVITADGAAANGRAHQAVHDRMLAAVAVDLGNCFTFHCIFHPISTNWLAWRVCGSQVHLPCEDQTPMSTMRLTLIFSSFSCPRLQETEFTDTNGKIHKCTDSLGAAIEGKIPDFKWTAGTKAISLLLVQFAAYNDRRLASEDGPAAVAFDVIRRAKTDEHWLCRILGDHSNIRRFFRFGGSPSANSVKWVEINTGVEVRIEAVDAGSVKTLTPKQSADLADALEKKFTKASQQAADDLDNEEEEQEPALFARPALLAMREQYAANYLPVDSNLLPLRAGDFVRLQAKLSKPSHVAAVWVTSEGEFFPLHPPGDFNWSTFSEAANGIQVNLPSDSEMGYPLDTPTGVETAIFFLREKEFGKEELEAIREKCAATESPCRFKKHDLETATPRTLYVPRNGGENVKAEFRISHAQLPPTHLFEAYQRAIAKRFDGLEIDGLCLYSIPYIGASK